MDQLVECYKCALHIQPCRHKYRDQLTKSRGIQIPCPLSTHSENRASSWVPIGHAQKTPQRVRNQVSSFVFFVMYAKTKRHLARPFPVAGARKNKMSSTRPFFSHRKLRQVIPIIACSTTFLLAVARGIG
ncbi:hypothetical protein ACSS6W_009126 [Trichoderma asperelloides]